MSVVASAMEVAGRHIGVAIVVIVVSRAIGTWILARVSG
jgi:hypothetical protein